MSLIAYDSKVWASGSNSKGLEYFLDFRNGNIKYARVSSGVNAHQFIFVTKSSNKKKKLSSEEKEKIKALLVGNKWIKKYSI